MPLKSADDKTRRTALLEDLQHASTLDAEQKKWLTRELMLLRKGIQGEKDAAFYLDQYFRDSKNHVVLHDLRLELEGDVAQIDHLVINRAASIYLIETKNFNASLIINERGEFTADYGSQRYGVPSPIEQNQRHARILRRLLKTLCITTRGGGDLDLHPVVLLHPKAIISRPPTHVFDTRHVIKADQFPSWHKHFVDQEIGLGGLLKAAVNMRSLESITEWGEKLRRQHRPANGLELPAFMKPRVGPAAPPVAPPAAAQPPSPSETAPAKRLNCAQCGIKISYAEGQFCWSREQRFGGRQYCREHQAGF
jgi:hypothetical protein